MVSVTQAKYCFDHGYFIQKSDLVPGDLIFWTKNSCHCGRWHEIHHVAIYIGNGRIIEAISSKGCVVINDIWGEGSGGKWQILYYAHTFAEE